MNKKKQLFKIDHHYMPKPSILFNSLNKSYMLKCPKCNYTTNKTYNYDIHKCLYAISDISLPKNPFISSKVPKIEIKSKMNYFNSNSDGLTSNENEIDKSTPGKDELTKFAINLKLLKKIFNSNDHLNIQEIDFGNDNVYDLKRIIN